MRFREINPDGPGRRPAIGLLAGLVMVAAMAAACGDDSVETLSKEDYIAQANTICAAGNAESDEAFEEFFATAFADLPDGANTLEEAQSVTEALDAMFDDVITPGFEEQLADLRALAAPGGDADELAAIYDDLESALDEYNATLDEAVSGDQTAMESVGTGSAERVFDDVNRRARDYGLDVCGEEDE